MSDLSGWSHSNNLRRDELVGDQTVSFERGIVAVSLGFADDSRNGQRAGLKPRAHDAGGRHSDRRLRRGIDYEGNPG